MDKKSNYVRVTLLYPPICNNNDSLYCVTVGMLDRIEGELEVGF